MHPSIARITACYRSGIMAVIMHCRVGMTHRIIVELLPAGVPADPLAVAALIRAALQRASVPATVVIDSDAKG